MEKNTDFEAEVLTETEDAQKEKETATTPEEKSEITIPVKYNKEIKELDIKTAALLAQKGMKYDAIKDNYDELLNLAIKSGKSVPQYINDLKAEKHNERMNYLTEKCGGDSELAEHISRLEESDKPYDNGFNELKAMFPEFETEEDVPTAVLDSTKANGTLLLDEYLRYKLRSERDLKEAKEQLKKTENLSLGSQINRKGAESPETEEFLKGLWK